MDSEIKKLLNEALNSSEPEKQLVKLVEKLKTKGWNQLEVYDVFESYMDLLSEAEREYESDIVMEVVARIYGWCPPDMQLFSRCLENVEIERYRETKHR